MYEPLLLSLGCLVHTTCTILGADRKSLFDATWNFSVTLQRNLLDRERFERVMQQSCTSFQSEKDEMAFLWESIFAYREYSSQVLTSSPQLHFMSSPASIPCCLRELAYFVQGFSSYLSNLVQLNNPPDCTRELCHAVNLPMSEDN